MKIEIVEQKRDEKGNIICQKTDDGKEIFFKYDDRNNCICVSDGNKRKIIKRYDENNRLIYLKFFGEGEYFYKWVEGEQISITKQEFERIKKNKEHKEFLSREKINPFELIDLE